MLHHNTMDNRQNKRTKAKTHSSHIKTENIQSIPKMKKQAISQSQLNSKC